MSTTQPTPLSPDADIVLEEYGETDPLDGEQLPQRAQQVVENEINKGDDDRLRIEWLADGRVKLHATSYVGIVTLPGGLTIEIRPKVDNTDLLSVLQYSQGIRADTIDEETSITRGNEFIHALATLFESELADVIQRGLASEYRRHADTEDHVRGRIAVHRQLQQHGPQPTQFECNYDSLTQDTILNQSILYATELLLGLVSDSSVSNSLQRHKQVLQRVTELRPVRSVELAQVELSRLADYYTDLFRLTKLIIRGKFADKLTAGPRSTFSLLINMNDIFESILERGLTETFAEGSVQIKSQVSSDDLFQNGARKITIRPDILAVEDGKPRFVGDAKWKQDQQYSREPSNSDLYQLLSYQIAHNVPGILFYPEQNEKVASTYSSKFEYDIHLVEVPTTAVAGMSYADTVKQKLRKELPVKPDTQN